MAMIEDLAAGPVREAVVSFVTGYASRLTRVAYLNDLTLWLRHCAAEDLQPFDDVRRTHIERYARLLEEQHRSPATVGRRLSTIAGFYRWCVDEALVEHSPAANVRRPRRLTESPRAGLTRPELKDWLDAQTPKADRPTPWRACWPSTDCGSTKSAPPTSLTCQRTDGTTPCRSSARATSQR